MDKAIDLPGVANRSQDPENSMWLEQWQCCLLAETQRRVTECDPNARQKMQTGKFFGKQTCKLRVKD